VAAVVAAAVVTVAAGAAATVALAFLVSAGVWTALAWRYGSWPGTPRRGTLAAVGASSPPPCWSWCFCRSAIRP
jgi:hypothetical protein